ncbi:MAG: sulfurtransferase TusA family protein [Saccharospirillum sp.]|nr:sulfurtransferase TusA family protein [Saccharospirillum sp.]
MACKTSEVQLVDATGLRCPLPLLRTKQTLNAVEAGQLLEVLATDPGSLRDIPAFIGMTSHQLLEQTETTSGHYRFLIQKGEG